jgi:hypothetical protein
MKYNSKSFDCGLEFSNIMSEILFNFHFRKYVLADNADIHVIIFSVSGMSVQNYSLSPLKSIILWFHKKYHEITISD